MSSLENGLYLQDNTEIRCLIEMDFIMLDTSPGGE